jgi:probable addiction module antidote protein
MPARKREKPETFTGYDTASYLDTEVKVAAYLDAALEEGDEDPAFLTRALMVVARTRNISQLARAADMSREGLYKALSPDGNPSFGTVLRLVRAMGLRIGVKPYGSSRSTRQPSPLAR